MELEKLREKLNETIEKYGVSSKEAYEISLEMDIAIAKFYKKH